MEMVHLIKLAVGIRSPAHLATAQSARLAHEGRLQHLTRNAPKRAREIIESGSIYWVIAGVLVMRQRIIAIEAARRDDGRGCVALVLDPSLVAVQARPTRPFQGWRYLASDAAPPDLCASVALTSQSEGPVSLLRQLRAQALI